MTSSPLLENHKEKHFTAGEVVRDIIIGVSDGLTVPFALAAGLSGANAPSSIILTAGVAEVAAGAISMGLGGYLAAKSEADHYIREQDEIISVPDTEAAEIEEILSEYGLGPNEYGPVVTALRKNRQAWLDFMMNPMAIRYLTIFLLPLLFLPLLPTTTGIWLPFFSSGSATPDGHLSISEAMKINTKAEFSLKTFENQEGKKLLEDARMKQLTLNTCWQEAYRNLFGSCSEIIVNEEKHKQLAWMLSDCFVKDSGQSSLPSCNMKGPMKECRKKLQDFENDIYLQFFIQTNAICHQLQADAFKRDTEKLINDLKDSAHTVKEKLELLEGRSEEILEGSTQIHDSLDSIELQTQKLAQKSSDVESQIDDVLKNSEVIYEQTKGIAASQTILQEGQTQLKERLESSMESLHKSYENLGHGLDVLKDEAIQIEREINQVGDLMSSKMNNLQTTADSIEHVAGVSLDKQKQVLNGQTKALEDLEFLTKFQSQALEESRATLQKLAEFGHKQQEELLLCQKQIQKAHDRLIQNSQSILAAQEEFESKQATIFNALDKLFALHNAILVESRFIKSFFFYCSVIFLIYLLTSAKQTFAVRARLYLGLCLSFGIEIGLLRFGATDFQAQSWTSKVFMGRSAFLMASLLQILYSIFTYRDYEVLNHRMLQELKEKIDTMEGNKGKQLLSLSMGSDIDLYSWIDKELPEEVNSYDDPDYHYHEEVAENSIACSVPRSYDLRPRGRR